MNPSPFEILRITRKNLISLVQAHSLEQLNHIPEGFNNNLIWNFGHVLVTQQLLCYKLAGLTPLLSDEIIDRYKKGTAPTSAITKEEYQYLIEQANQLVVQAERDFLKGKFTTYNPYQASYGIELNSIEKAFAFNNIHEGLHLGYMMSLRKSL